MGCREYQVSDDPTLRLSFSTDTLCFDTVFTAQGSATAQVMVYNRNASALIVDRVWLTDGKAFFVNVDGEPQLDRLTNLQINGGDSAFVFIRVEIDPTGSNTPLLVTDQLHFHLANGTTQQIELEAYGQDVTRIGKPGCKRTDKTTYTFTADKPYILYDTLVVGGTMTIEAGATLYMHSGACIFALGDVDARGTLDAPIVIRGDRLDNLFDSVPYLYAGGSWNGLYLQAEQPHTYDFQYVDILSGNIGLYCYSNCVSSLPVLRMNGCRIHNHALYGLVLINTGALVTNTEISNCASYCVYCAGGNHQFIHSTVASYFNYTSIRIQSVAKEDAAAVYIDNLSKTGPQTVTSFYNSIITGFLSNQLVVATPFDQFYPGTFVGNYLKTDTLRMPHAANNVYWQKSDTAKVFVNDFYKYKEYIYYDFRLDSLSPAIGIGDSIVALPYPTDRNGINRANTQPDAGCYQHN
ncbi:MAG: hypothetical protein IKQ50_05965 [Paludibacteraceae bacterium]|nr:hypothetical protein [Paludibacteraceae bacterium]